MERAGKSELSGCWRRWTRVAVGGVAVWGVCVYRATVSSAAASAPQQPVPSATPATSAGATVWTGVYNAAQAKRGEASSIQKCVICHGEELLGGEAPGLVGPDFLGHWYTQSAWDLFDRIKTTMPATTPGTLSAQESADLLAYMLSVNGFPAGEKELPSDKAALSQIRITERAP